MSDHYILSNGVVTDGITFLNENCDIEIKGKKIIRIGKALEADQQIKKIDLGGRLVLPGLLNPHHHLYSALATGLAPIGPTNNFQQILDNLWWHLDRSLDEGSIYYSAMNGLMQSVRYGVTTVIDHHASMNAIGGSLNIIKKAFNEVGLKGVLCYEISDRMGEASLQEQIDENVDFWTANQANERIQGLMGLHANFTLSEKSMEIIAKEKFDALPIHIHCGEDIADFQFCKDLGYEGPVHRLNEFGLLTRDALLAHCIHLSKKDHELLSEIQPHIISNPESNANNNVGQMDMQKIKKYVLGTDGMTGNILGTMRSHFLQRRGDIPNPLKVLFRYPADMMNAYFPNSGTLKVNGTADIAISNYRPVTPISKDNLFYHLMFGVQGKEMHMTISEGKIVFSDNTIHSVDEDLMNKEIAAQLKNFMRHTMRDTLYPIPVGRLLQTILSSLKQGSVFGIYKSSFFVPDEKDDFTTAVFNQYLETPIGLAAGPHTQMAQNIIAGWLCGARYIELKTVQTLDEIEVSKPCIDISDEGYNCEWSQELKIRESYEEYLKAWIIIHILRRELKYSDELGSVFNMSVGYDMKGILNENVQWFFDKMNDCSIEKTDMINEIREIYPKIDTINIPNTISNNITLSTMHGCPADEIETIGHYLLTEKKLHTLIKLNPTLLGKNAIHEILRSQQYTTIVPNVAFEHDIKFDAACALIEALDQDAEEEKLFFGIKLTNTLESLNNKDIFSDESMYMSGKALHPISINVAAKLREVFPDLMISFCGGVNAGNIKDVLSCGLNPVTVCSDVLLPGGYTRLLQYLENIGELPIGDHNVFLANYAESIKDNAAYRHREKSIKTARELNAYDCIAAPCVDTCPTHQNIPAYLAFINRGENEKALETILNTNPFPSSTGMICDHSCQTKCTRINYDDVIRIRDIKRYIAENTKNIAAHFSEQAKGKKVAVIGAGPSGLSCAYYLALSGCDVDVYETKAVPGSMLADVIPAFRLSEEALKRDIETIKKSGVSIHTNSKVTKESFEKLHKECDYVYVAIGAQNAMEANIPGSEGVKGYLDPLVFLSNVKHQQIADLGDNIIILGGGNTAIDVARTARRICAPNSTVSIVYRRTQHEMPADNDEIQAALEENIQLLELASPARVLSKDGKITALECHSMRLEKAENNARPKPVIIPGKEFELPVDTLIPAFGQSLNVDFVDEELLQSKLGLETRLENVFIGGDAYRGASFLIKAIADGKDVAIQILTKMGIEISGTDTLERDKSSREQHHQKLSRIIPGIKLKTREIEDRTLDALVDLPMSNDEVILESARCVNCDEICDICITVCPNRANVGYELKPIDKKIEKIMVNNGMYTIVPDSNFIIEQQYQILNIADLCNECGNCTTFCPTEGRPFADKPNVALSPESFESMERGYWNTGDHMLCKQNDVIYRLDVEEDGYVYSSPSFTIKVDKKFSIKQVELKDNWIGEISLRTALNMHVIKKAIESVIN